MAEGGPGEQRELQGSEWLALDDAHSLYRVIRGSIALFSVGHRDGEPQGARSYLFDIGEGEVMAGLGRGAERMIIAVPVGSATLRSLDRCESAEVAVVLAALESWADTLADRSGIDRPSRPLPTTLAEFDELLHDLHAAALEALQERALRQAELAERRAAAREQHNVDAVTTAVRKLRAVVDPDPILAMPEGDSLFTAVYAVGRALGITIRPLPRSVDPEQVADPVEALARASQVLVRRVLLRGAWWLQDCGPLLAFTREHDRPVALLPRAAGRYVLYDPDDETERPVDEAVARELAAEAHVLYRPFPSKQLGSLDLVRFALRGRRKDLVWILVCGLLATGVSMFTPIATGQIVDSAIPDANHSMVWQLGMALVGASFGHVLYTLTAGLITVRVETKADADTQAAVWDRLLRLPMSFFRRFDVGDLEQRVSAVQDIRATLSGTTLRSLIGGVLATLNLGLLVYYIPSLAIVACLTALASAALTVGAALVTVRYQRELIELQGEISGSMFQLIQGVPKLRIAAAEERGFLHWAERYARQQELALTLQRTHDALRVLNLWVSGGGIIVLFWFAVQMLAGPGGASLSSGVFLAFYVAYGAFQLGISDVSNLSHELLIIKVLRERAQPILDATPEVDEHKADPGRIVGKLAIERVRFRYRSDGPLVLNDVSVQAEPGERVALVGPSGSGKSTIVRLLLGFEAPESGVIAIDGQDIRGLNMPDVRRQLGVVLQSGRINAGSIFENIATGRLITLTQAEEAIKLAGMAEDLAQMPMGIHTVISEGGTNLSGGQRQRLLIARALALDPSLLVFDEATSALDNRTQAIVTQSLERLQVTQIVVAHRLSTIRTADRIYVLSKGQIIEQGSFAQLMAQDGFFAKLMRRQAA